MLTKIQELKNVGVFADDSAGLDRLSLEELTLVYASNASGKTTLSAVLHAAMLSDYGLISERRRVGETGLPGAKLRFGKDLITLSDGTWDRKPPPMVVFDEHFVRSNVFAVDGVRTEHRKRLFGLIVGEEGVTLASKRTEYRDGATKALQEQRVKQAEIERRVKGIENFTAFLGLEEQGQIEERIQVAKDNLKVVREATLKRPVGSLGEVKVVPISLGGVERILAQTVDDVSADAVLMVSAHASSLGDGAEEWISDGQKYAHEDACPYCLQGTEGLPIVAAYRQFFNASYNSLRDRVDAMARRPAVAFSAGEVLRIATDVANQDAHWAYWSALLELPDLPAVGVEFGVLAGQVRKALDDSSGRKRETLLDAIALSDEERNSIQEWVDAMGRIGDRNAMVREALPRIRVATADKAQERIRGLEKEVGLLELARRRHEPEIHRACRDFIDLGHLRKRCTNQKDDADHKLASYVKRTFGEYSKQINANLKRMGAGFRIADLQANKRDAGAEWGVLVRSTVIPVRDATKKPGVHCLRTALSAGDRTTLALAFFLARVAREEKAEELTLVLDDPMCSLDEFRRGVTVKIIGELVKMVRQVIVLSHDATFLGKVYLSQQKRTGGARPKIALVRLTTVEGTAKADPWAIDKDLCSEYERDVERLVAFATAVQHDPCPAVRSARPALEAWIRMSNPPRFQKHQMLGAMIDSARAQTSNGDPIFADEVLALLGDLNDYFREHMHATRDDLNESEARSEVTKALGLVYPHWRD